MKTLKLTLLSLALSLTAFAQTVVTKEGTGEAAVVNKDELKAFDEAKDKALRAAIEQASGVRIDADTVVVNNQLVRDQVFANTSGYVKKFDVLEKKVDKGVMTVKVKADIITESLEKDVTAARDLVKRIGRPKVIILMQESTLQADGKAVINSNTFSTVLSEAFTSDGYDLKDPAYAAGKVRIAPGVVLQQGEAKEIGDLAKADFIVYGTATFRQQSMSNVGDGKNSEAAGGMFDKNLFLVSGEYDLSVFATRSGSSIAKISNNFSFKEPGAAIKNSLVSYERTALELARARKGEINASVRKAILEYFRNELVNGARLELAVAGLDSFAAAKDFKKSIEGIKGIKEATQDTFANGKAAYRITYLGSSQDFAEAIEASTFKKKKLTIVSVTGNTLEVQVAK
jgi:hypothetical protein